MPQPTPYTRNFSFTDFATAKPAEQMPGSAIDAELDGVGETLGDVLASIAKLQRDDGALRNGAVGVEQLSASALALLARGTFAVRGQWAAATAYAAGDFYADTNKVYLVTAAHTATGINADIAAGKVVGPVFYPDTAQVEALQADLAASPGAGTIGTSTGGTVESDLATLKNFKAALAVSTALSGAKQVGAFDYEAGAKWTTAQGFIDRILSQNGSASMGYKHKLAGTVPRTAEDKLNDTVDIRDFNVDLTGATSAVAKIQAAIDAVAAAGGGTINFPNAYYLIDGQVQVKRGVHLNGLANGPFDNTASPLTTLVAPTFLITYTADTAFLMSGASAKISDFLFYWPNQVAVTAATPTSYPYAIGVVNGTASQTIERCTFVNAYQAINIQSGRTRVSDCLIGAFANDINVDNALDWVELHNIKCQVMWDVFAGVGFGQTIDTWVMNNSIALKTGRVDSLQVTNFGLFCRYVGHQAGLNASYAVGSRGGYGRLTNVDFDYVAYGIIAAGTNEAVHGFRYTNMDIGANASGVGTSGQITLLTQTGAGAGDKPWLTWVSGSKRGTFAAGGTGEQRNDGYIFYGEDIRGVRPVGSVTPPTAPASTVGVQNTKPYPVRVGCAISGGSASDVTINGSGTGLGGSNFGLVLAPFETIAITYTGTLAWAWFGL